MLRHGSGGVGRSVTYKACPLEDEAGHKWGGCASRCKYAPQSAGVGHCLELKKPESVLTFSQQDRADDMRDVHRRQAIAPQERLVKSVGLSMKHQPYKLGELVPKTLPETSVVAPQLLPRSW